MGLSGGYLDEMSNVNALIKSVGQQGYPMSGAGYRRRLSATGRLDPAIVATAITSPQVIG
jgi:hypothetical protein